MKFKRDVLTKRIREVRDNLVAQEQEGYDKALASWEEGRAQWYLEVSQAMSDLRKTIDERVASDEELRPEDIPGILLRKYRSKPARSNQYKHYIERLDQALEFLSLTLDDTVTLAEMDRAGFRIAGLLNITTMQS